jgi:hypothetical protein
LLVKKNNRRDGKYRISWLLIHKYLNCVQGFGGETWGKETTRETQA